MILLRRERSTASGQMATASVVSPASKLLRHGDQSNINFDMSTATTRRHYPYLRSISGVLAAAIFCLIEISFVASNVRGEEKAPPDPAANPAEKVGEVGKELKAIQGVIRGLLGQREPAPVPRANRKRTVRPGMPGNEESNDARDPVESRAPHDAKVEQLLSVAESAVRKKNWKSAVELIQRLLDQPEDSLHRTADGQWKSIRRTANRILGQLPEATLAEYRAQFGGLAQQQLAAAKRSRQTADFVNVATRFFHTTAGYEAAHYLGSLHFDRSEFGLAARWFEELAASPSTLNRSDPWLMQAAMALTRAGDSKGATALLGRLSRGPSTLVTIGTGQATGPEWLSRIHEDLAPQSVALAEWTQLYGSSARIGTAVGGDPLLSPIWSLPLTSSHTVRNSLKWLVQDLQDQQRALILASTPLVADGKVIYRDLRGVRSVDIEQGHPIWESVEGSSPERILGGLPPQQVDPQDGWRFRMNPFQNQGDYQGLSAENSPLASLLFRDGTYGLISSDGKQLFALEDHGILSRNQAGQHWGWDGNPEPQDPFGLPWKTNRLVSYDLRTGRQLWSLGGSELKESFDLPLAGSYFYGTPAIDGDELFVVAGKGDDVRLWSLDRRSGTPRWSQLIAYSDTKIDLDIARRWVTSQVAVGNGVIVCPTTVGWLVAVDRMRQSVLWAYRYATQPGDEMPEHEPGMQFVPQKELNATWTPSAPVLAGSYVVYTPQEEASLICLNAVDGRQIWTHPKERGLYLAGVFGKKVVIVGETGVTAFQLDTGKTAWTAPFDEGVRPSGRGVAVDDRYYLPLANGELRSIELATGKLLSQTFVASQQPSLGNLAMHRGKLVSLSPSGLTAFGQRDALLAEIRQRIAVNPDDAWGLMRSGEILLLNHQYAEALPLLRRIAIDRLTTDDRLRHRAIFVECLSVLIHSDVLHRGTELEELRALAESPPEELLYRELSAEKLLAEQKPVAAFEVLVQLAEDAKDSMLARTDDRRVTVKQVAWLSGRMHDLWEKTAEPGRRSIDNRIGEIAAEAAGRSMDACQRAATLFAFHPASISVKRRLVEWLIDTNDLGRARLVLQELAGDPDSVVAANAIERLAQLMVRSELPADASYYYQLLQSRYAETIVRDGLSGSRLVAGIHANTTINPERLSNRALWPESQMHAIQSVMNYTQPPQEVAVDSPLPFFNRLGLEAHQSEQRLTFESTVNGRLEWMVPLKGELRGGDEGSLVVQNIGHELFFVNRGVLHAISPIEKKNLWSKSLDDSDDGTAIARHPNRIPVPAMSGSGQIDGSRSLLLQRANNTGRLALVQPGFLCVYGRRSLLVLNPRTGESLWQLDGLPTNAVVLGTRDAIFAMVQGKDEVLAYRAIDGKPLNIPGLTKLLNNALMSHGSAFLVMEPGDATSLLGLKIGQQKSRLKLFDPVLGETKWQIELSDQTVISPMGDEEVVAVGSDGKVQRIDVVTGHVIDLEPVPTKKSEKARRKYILFDEDRIYLISNSPNSEHQSFSENLASIPLSGTVNAWDRRTGKYLWQHGIKHQSLVVDRFSKLPVLLCVSRTWKAKNGLTELKIHAIHKRTGATLLDVSIPSVNLGFNAVGINLEEPSIELKSFNLRMRLIPENIAAATDTGTAPASSKTSQD